MEGHAPRDLADDRNLGAPTMVLAAGVAARPGRRDHRAGDPAAGPGRIRRRALLLLPVFAPALPVAAHSELRRSVPAAGAVLEQPPDRIELHFNERVQLTALRLRRVDGDEIALPRRAIREATSETVILPPLAPGEYRADWRIISADGHPAGGVIAFRIAGPRRP